MTMRSSRVVRSLSLLIAVGGLCVPSMEAVAQRRGPAAISTEIVQSTSPLDAAQRREVEAFTRTHVSELANGDPAEVVSARDALLGPTRLLNVTGVFLRSYSEAIIPAITPILDSDDSMRAENALRVLAFLRTPESTGLLVESIDPARTTDSTRRLVAAGLLGLTVEAVPHSGLGSAVLVSTARGIAEAAAVETDWLVTLEELRALNAIALNPTLTKENRAQVRGMQFQAFAEIAGRIESNTTPDPLVHAIYRAILGLRGKLLDNALAGDVSTKDIAATLRGTLIDIAGGAIRQWNGLDQDPSMLEAYEGTIRVGAQLFSLLEGRQDAKIDALAAPMSAALAAKPGSPARREAKAALEAALAKAL